jgi:hypothetical protein
LISGGKPPGRFGEQGAINGPPGMLREGQSDLTGVSCTAFPLRNSDDILITNRIPNIDITAFALLYTETAHRIGRRCETAISTKLETAGL